ncbi:MAG: OmpW family protein [Proteobacteria bacterium]|nr:OmpW family protein [Pseudomonadota bacterium]
MSKFGVVAVAVLGLAIGAPAVASADQLTPWQIRLGISEIAPDESGSPIPASIGNATVPTAQIEYFFNDNISAELLCCVATHNVSAAHGAVNLGHVTHFPPTVTLKYHWTNFGALQPYVGAGVNYTNFINSDPPAGLRVHYSSSWGPALQAGADYKLNDHWSVGLDVRRIWISTDVRIRGAVNADDSVDINPWVVSATVGYRF